MIISTSDIHCVRVQFKDDVNLEEDSGTRDGLYLILVSQGTYSGPNDRTLLLYHFHTSPADLIFLPFFGSRLNLDNLGRVSH